jgi:hypothetical protein
MLLTALLTPQTAFVILDEVIKVVNRRGKTDPLELLHIYANEPSKRHVSIVIIMMIPIC